MSVPMSQVLATARTYLNDDSAALWQDPALIPKIQEAHREMQIKLWLIGSPIVRGLFTQLINISVANTLFTALPADFLVPYYIQEAPSPAATPYMPMTEVDFIPLGYTAVATLVYWRFNPADPLTANVPTLTFPPCTTARVINCQYRRLVSIPVLTTDLIGVAAGEYYLAPRAAAIAAGTLGNKGLSDALTQQAEDNFGDVILANRGQQKPSDRP